jgi:FixJ family two-component response regulator
MKNAIKILIVDDDKSSSALLGEVVKRMGFKPVVVGKPADALNVAKLQTMHAAIVDVLLPKMSGVDLAVAFRKTKFAENPVIFVSGVFKDKNFAAEAMKKSGAVDFLFKPYSADELMTSLNSVLAGLLTTEKWTAQSLLVRKLASPRECAKAIEHLERTRGQEFPLVLSILLEAGLSGHLNIVNDGGEIFGVTLAHGALADVDSTESQATAVLALISNGFLAQEDWDNFQKNEKKKFPLDRLVQDGLVSPHAVAVAKHEQILSDIKAICSAQSLQINFVPSDDSEEAPKHAVTMKQLMKLLATSLEEFFPTSYLEEFYSVFKSSPFITSASPEAFSGIWGGKTFARLTGLRQAIEEGGTLEAALAAHPDDHLEIYACLHYLVLSRCVMFDDVQRTKSMNSMLERYRQLHAELKDRTADKVFEYFGVKERVNSSTIEKVFEEYTRSNHPDQLPKDASPELVELCRGCFQLVSAAYEIMIDDGKRAALYENLKVESTQRLKKSNELTAQGLELLRKGQFQQALDLLRQAGKLHSSTLQFLIQIWAEVKSGTLSGKSQLSEAVRKLDSLPAEDRKSAYFFMTMGVVKKALGDPGAQACFERVMQMDSSFVEARRELNSLNNSRAGKEKKLDIFNGDITEIVSHLFRRKAE